MEPANIPKAFDPYDAVREELRLEKEAADKEQKKADEKDTKPDSV